MSLSSIRMLLITAAAVGGIGLTATAFADDSGDYTAPPPPAVLSPVQIDLAAIQQHLQQLVSLSKPGTVVTISLVPDEDPSQILVSVSDPGGEHATDVRLDAAYIRSLVKEAPAGASREALKDALQLTAERIATMHALSPSAS